MAPTNVDGRPARCRRRRLIVQRYGHRDPHHGGLTLRPGRVGWILKRTANDKRCPRQRLRTYPEVPAPDPSIFDAYSEGGLERNGFYRHGIVDAFRVVLNGRTR